MKLGYVGVGSMGGALATRLCESHEVEVFDLSAAAIAKLEAAGAKGLSTARDVGAANNIVFICLQTSNQVRSAIFGPEGIAAGMKPGGMIVDQSTGDAILVREMAKELEAHGIDLIDVPVSGGPQYALAGTIALMAGGTDAQFERIRPVLETISPNIFHCGPVGSGHVMKVTNNLLAASQRLLTFEVVSLAVKNGLNPRTVVEAMLKGSGRNYVLDVTFQRHILPGQLHQGFTLGLMQKDVKLATKLAGDSGVPLLIGHLVDDYYGAIIADLGADAEVNMALRYIEDAAGAQVTPEGATAEPVA
jgi:3-hydroxyisobutyrate dehydrogenase